MTRHSPATHHTRSMPAPSGMPRSRCPPVVPADWLVVTTRRVGVWRQPEGILTAEKQVVHTQSFTLIIHTIAD